MEFGSSSADTIRAGVAFLSSVVGLIGLALSVVERGKKKRQQAMQAVPPSAPALAVPPQTTNPFGVDPSITGKLLEANVSIARSEWALGELKDELRKCREERDEVAQDAKRTAATLVATESQLRATEVQYNSALVKLASLERVAQEWRDTAARLERNVDLLKARLRTERVDPEALKTPLRPPRLKESL